LVNLDPRLCGGENALEIVVAFGRANGYLPAAERKRGKSRNGWPQSAAKFKQTSMPKTLLF